MKQKRRYNMSNYLLGVLIGVGDLQTAQLNNERVTADTTNDASMSLQKYYEYANQQLEIILNGGYGGIYVLPDGTTEKDPGMPKIKNAKNSSDDDDKSNEIKETEIVYNQANTWFQNFENTLNTSVQNEQSETQRVAQNQQTTVQFGSDTINLLTYVGNLLQSRLG